MATAGRTGDTSTRLRLRRQRMASLAWLLVPVVLVVGLLTLIDIGGLGQLMTSWKSLVEIAVFVLLFQVLFRLMQGTRGEGILKGMTLVLLGGFLLLLALVQVLELPALRVVLGSVLQYALIALVIIFQPELRRGLMRVGEKRFVRLFIRDNVSVVDEVVEAALRMAKNRIGALIAIEREVGLGTYIEGGVQLDAQVSAELLETIFFPGTPLHDGAVVIREQRIAAAGCFFPLTDDPTVSKHLGSRHRAGKGLSEETDAVTVICSEETGQVSIAVAGELHRNLDKAGLESMLRRLISTPGAEATLRPPGGGEGLLGPADAAEPPPASARPAPEATAEAVR